MLLRQPTTDEARAVSRATLPILRRQVDKTHQYHRPRPKPTLARVRAEPLVKQGSPPRSLRPELTIRPASLVPGLVEAIMHPIQPALLKTAIVLQNQE